MAGNTLYYGDNLDVLRRYGKDDSVDLIYLDPPFNSNQDYNVLFAEQDGSRSAAQIKAFGDTWRWDQGSATAYRQMVEGGGQVSQVMQAFHTFLGENDMLAYLSMMAPRLIELRRVLKPTGSIYLHCDPTASHFLKLLMVAVFGSTNFLIEIVWYYRGAGVPKKSRANRHDILLHYAKREGEQYFNPDPIRRPYAEATAERFSHYIGNVRGGRDYGVQELNPLGKHPDDVITHIQPIAPSARARLGYPTQKPEELLEEIIAASSKEGDLILDPFCGCGTTIAVAEHLKRQWAGIDITHLAITLIKNRLKDATNGKATYSVIGEPTTLQDAEVLAADDKYQFQWWALGLVGARPADPKKGADKGVDGRLYFHDEKDETKTKQVILSVKGGKLKPDDIRALKGVVIRESAHIGVLITFEPPTKSMRADAAGGGVYHSPGYDKDYPALQILTVEELLGGKSIEMPPQQQVSVTFKKAPRFKGPTASKIPLPEGAQ